MTSIDRDDIDADPAAFLRTRGDLVLTTCCDRPAARLHHAGGWTTAHGTSHEVAAANLVAIVLGDEVDEAVFAW